MTPTEGGIHGKNPCLALIVTGKGGAISTYFKVPRPQTEIIAENMITLHLPPRLNQATIQVMNPGDDTLEWRLAPIPQFKTD